MNIANEVFVFFEACVLGILFGALFDAFRIIRLSFKNPKSLIFVEDVLYFTVITLASFIFIVIENSGSLRAFLMIGEILGGIFYFFTISIPIMKSANFIIRMINGVLVFLYKITLRPFVKLFRYIVAKSERFILKCKCNAKNIVPKFKIHLK